MLRSLPADSAPRIRLLAKFVERDYEKIERLIKIRREYASRVSVADQSIKKDRADLSVTEQGNREDEWLSLRLDAGLFSLQVSGRFSLVVRPLTQPRPLMLFLLGLLQKTTVPGRRRVKFWQIETSRSTTSGQVYKVCKSSCALRADADCLQSS